MLRSPPPRCPGTCKERNAASTAVGDEGSGAGEDGGEIERGRVKERRKMEKEEEEEKKMMKKKKMMMKKLRRKR